MACGGCNSVAPVTKDQVENLIQKAIDSGKVQGGLKTCAGEKLPAESKVLMCSEVVDAVNEAIEKSDIKVIKDVVYKEHKIVVTDGEGKDHEYELPYPEMAIGNKEVVFTQPDGTTVAVPKSDAVLTEDDFDKTIVKGANEDGKLGVKAKPNGGLEVTETGVGVKAGDGIKVGEDGSLQIGEVFANKPILGKGTKADPLKLSLNNDQFQVNAATGEVSLKPTDSTLIKNLNTGIQKVGYSTFYGYIGKERGDYVTGVPADINSTNATENATSEISQLADGQAYDFNGWQIASPAQVDQYLAGTDQAVWHRVNDSGMNKDGTLVDPTAWTVWHRETNVTANVLQVEAMQKQVDDLTKRVGTLEKLLGSFVNIKDASGKVLLGAIKP
nr:MAG TPA: fiber protein [Caudoviricetes sp.]